MKTRRTAAVALAAALALTVSGCAKGNTSSDNSDNGATLPTTAWDSAKYADVKQGGTLTLAISQLPDNYNNWQVNGGLQDTFDLQVPTMGGGVTTKSDGSWAIDKNYATSIKLTKQDPETIEVKLNKKGVWSDGKPIVAQDMINYWKSSNGTNKAFEAVSTGGFQDIGSVTQGADEYSYTVVFKKKNADWPNYVYPALPSLVTKEPKVFNKAYAKKMFPSAGPYVISKIDQNAQVITETPNPKWWGDKPKLDKIIFRVVDQSAQAQAFANKEIDAVSIGQDKASYDTAKKRADVQIQRAGGLTWTHLTFNGTRGPLKDVKVRRAIAHAINREGMSAAANKPVGAPAVTQGSMIYMPGQKGYKDAATPAIGFDLKKSEALLKKAGYKKDSNGLQTKGGKKLTLNVVVPSDTPTNAQRAQLIQGYLKKVGITVKLDTVPTAKYFNDYVIPLNFDMVTFSWQGTAFPVSTTQSLFNPIDSGQNFTGITSPKLADLWNKANAELDLAKQIALANDIDKELYSYVPLVTIAPTPTIFGVAKGLVNYGSAQFEYPDYTKVGFKK
ncbi:MAG: ABC transporter family substrate-binding protein [Aeromicrobium sp.]